MADPETAFEDFTISPETYSYIDFEEDSYGKIINKIMKAGSLKKS